MRCARAAPKTSGRGPRRQTTESGTAGNAGTRQRAVNRSSCCQTAGLTASTTALARAAAARCQTPTCGTDAATDCPDAPCWLYVAWTSKSWAGGVRRRQLGCQIRVTGRRGRQWHGHRHPDWSLRRVAEPPRQPRWTGGGAACRARSPAAAQRQQPKTAETVRPACQTQWWTTQGRRRARPAASLAPLPARRAPTGRLPLHLGAPEQWSGQSSAPPRRPAARRQGTTRTRRRQSQTPVPRRARFDTCSRVTGCVQAQRGFALPAAP